METSPFCLASWLYLFCSVWFCGLFICLRLSVWLYVSLCVWDFPAGWQFLLCSVLVLSVSERILSGFLGEGWFLKYGNEFGSPFNALDSINFSWQFFAHERKNEIPNSEWKEIYLPKCENVTPQKFKLIFYGFRNFHAQRVLLFQSCPFHDFEDKTCLTLTGIWGKPIQLSPHFPNG